MRDQQVNENRQMFQEENMGWVGQGEGLNAASYLPFWYTAGGHSLLMGRRRKGHWFQKADFRGRDLS